MRFRFNLAVHDVHIVHVVHGGAVRGVHSLQRATERVRRQPDGTSHAPSEVMDDGKRLRLEVFSDFV